MGDAALSVSKQVRACFILDSDDYINFAQASVEAGKFEEALRYCDLAVDCGPGNAAAYDLRSRVWLKLGQDRKAIEDLTAAISLSPQDASLLSERAQVRSKLRDFRGALDDYNLAVQLNPFGADLYAERAWARWDLSRDASHAIDDFSEAIRFDKSIDNVKMYLLFRGDMRFYLEDYSGAIADYNAAVWLDPYFYSGFYRERAVVKMHIGDVGGAWMDYSMSWVLAGKENLETELSPLQDWVRRIIEGIDVFRRHRI
ncbi:MAG: hypothetical protein JST89_14015 [Cyanobacteria bacterium SZAS-4]|nr:hypothetical protein [Cyanobacteria bacterium SZAS-4]